MNKIILVTGGTSGIGFATVKKFLEKGNKVVIAGIDKLEKIDEAMKKIISNR